MLQYLHPAKTKSKENDTTHHRHVKYNWREVWNKVIAYCK